MARNRYDVDEELESPFRWEHFKRSFVYVSRYKKRMIIALLVSFVGAVVALTGPLFMQQALDVAVPNKDVKQLLFLGGLLLLTVLVSVAANYIRGVLMARVGHGIVHDIRKDLFDHLQTLPFSYFDNRPHGKILVRVVHYINSISEMFSNGIINFIVEIINIVFICVFMLQVSVPLALITMAGLPVLGVFIFLIKHKQHRAWQNVSNKTSNLNAYVQESIDGASVTQMFNRQETNEGIFEKLSEGYRKAWLKMEVLFNAVPPTVEIVSQVVLTLVYIAGVYWFDPMVSFGVLLAMGTYASRFWQPITNLAQIYNQFINCVAYLERIFELIDEPSVIEDKEGAYKLPPITGEVEFDHVSFEYEPGVRILNDVSFTARPGESIALVGPTGAGKTTIVNLISRFYNIELGQVRIDQNSVMDVTLHSLRSQMGIMLQDSFIFSGTLMDNIRYGRLDATDEEVIAAAKAVHAHAFIVQMEHGYDTVVKERGGGLSQGQKQLIAFARTLLNDPKILVLDEATSSIDTATERLVQEGIALLLKGRTSFIIAHRLSTIERCDRILYIDQGRIAEEGSHEELMAKGGLYYQLYSSQMHLAG